MRVTMLVRNPLTHDSRVEKEARTLAEAGDTVTVVAEAAPGLADREERDGYRILRVPRPPGSLPGVRFLAYRRRILRALLATAPDILHAHDANALEPVAAVARRLGVPYVYDSHELWLQQTQRGHTRAYWSAFLAYYALVERRYVRGAAVAITVNEPIAARLARHYGRPFEVVPNYPDIDARPEPRDIRGLVGAETIPSGAPLALYLGGVQPGRGLEQVLDALVLAPGVHFAILGRGYLAEAIGRRAVERGVADRVHIIAPVPHGDVVAYASSATLGLSLIQPVSESYRLSLPNKLFECMAAGIPVVASRFPHVVAVVEGAHAGVCVDPTQPQQIAAAIRSLLADPASAAEMGRRGRRAVEDRYNWAAAARVLVDLYAGIRQRSTERAAST